MQQVLIPNKIAHALVYAKKNSWVWVTQDMSGKMRNMWSINTNSLTNPFCCNRSQTNTICAYCYSRKMLKGLRASCVLAFEYNSKLLSSNVLPENILPVICKPILRFSAHGELLNLTHMKNYLNIARKNPKTIFGFWTKRLDIVTAQHLKFKPKNIIYIYSNPTINDPMPVVPKQFDKIFSVYTKDFLAGHKRIKINCKGVKEGGCINCRKCYSPNKIRFIKEVIR